MSTSKFENEIITGNLIYKGILMPSVEYNITSVNTSIYTITTLIPNEINFFECNSTTTPITIILPLITSSNMIISIIDIGGYASVNNITIQTSGSNTVCGTSSIIIDGNYNSLRFISNLSSIWYIA